MSELLLLSGGIDSISLAAWRHPKICLTVDYGQRPAKAEIAAASEVCRALGLVHHIIRIPLGEIGCGVLAGALPSTASPNPEFWPFRNQLLITVGAMFAMKHSLARVLIGTVKSDQRHADGRATFVAQMTELLALQEGNIALEAPAIGLTSAQLVEMSTISPAVLGWAHSCHTSNIACGHCPGCNKHSETMQALGWNR